MRQGLGIVGMRRSGTSSVCLALSRLGVFFGESARLLPGDAFNEEGYWEHQELCSALRKFRASLGLISVEYDLTPDDWRERPQTEHWLGVWQDRLEREFLPSSTPWAWKEPDASLALPFVREASTRVGAELSLLICVRNPASVARSDQARSGSVPEQTVGAWLAHTLAALRESRGVARRVVLFEEFLSSPGKVLTPVVQDLGLSPSEEAWKAAEGSIRQDLAHHRLGAEALAPYPDLVRQTYELCLRAAQGIDAVEGEIDALYEEYLAWRKMFSRRPVETVQAMAQWPSAAEFAHAHASYRLGEGWRKVAFAVDARPGDPVWLFLYPLPATVWVRSARWVRDGVSAEAELTPGRYGEMRHRTQATSIATLYGPDQAVVMAPAGAGPWTLELELLVETSEVQTGQVFKTLSERLIDSR